MFSFAVTLLGNLFFGLTLLVFIALFAVKNPRRNLLLHLLLLSGLGALFYADNFVTMFIGWEVMGWSSYFIISQSASIKTSQKYIVFNLAAAFSLLAAIILLYGFCGTFEYGLIAFERVPETFKTVIALLFMIAVFIKSGVMPFHYWIVDTYDESGNIFSAILSAIISKAGIFLFLVVFTQMITAHMLPELFFKGVAYFGVLTSIIATFKAINEDAMKRLLAYSSIAQLGYIITVLALLCNTAIEAALYHTVIHTLVKLLLFINIAAIIYVTGKSKFSQTGGLLYVYPLSFVLLVIGIITLAGMPPLGGFNSKFLIYSALLEEREGLLLAAVMFSSAAAFLYCYKLVYGIYLGQSTQNSNTTYPKIPISFYIPQLISATLVVLLGIFPASIVPMLESITHAMGYNALIFSDMLTLQTPFAAFDGAIVMSLFVGLFVIILSIFVSLKNKATPAKDRFDLSYCGEVPDSKVNLHYGYGMGKELERISFVRLILKNSSAAIYHRVENSAAQLSAISQKLYQLSAQHNAKLMVLFFTILLLIGAVS